MTIVTILNAALITGVVVAIVGLLSWAIRTQSDAEPEPALVGRRQVRPHASRAGRPRVRSESGVRSPAVSRSA